MTVTDALARRPQVLPPTLPLARVKQHAHGTFLAATPLYLASHWRLGRSFPCLAPLLSHCPWCAGSERRDHAYIPVLLTHVPDRRPRVLLELPPYLFTENAELYGRHFTASRRCARAPVHLEISDRGQEEPSPPPSIPRDQVLRTLAKVYALPDPALYSTEAEWTLALQIRITSPDYTPGRHPEGTLQQ
jgi:hypothetical protein